jgi:hypothetical protein
MSKARVPSRSDCLLAVSFRVTAYSEMPTRKLLLDQQLSRVFVRASGLLPISRLVSTNVCAPSTSVPLFLPATPTRRTSAKANSASHVDARKPSRLRDLKSRIFGKLPRLPGLPTSFQSTVFKGSPTHSSPNLRCHHGCRSRPPKPTRTNYGSAHLWMDLQPQPKHAAP